jgi:RNA-directed DNA polymerase
MAKTAIAERLAEVGLELHLAKTRIVYCKDSRRPGTYGTVSFTFLGYTFRPRKSWNAKQKQAFTGFLPAMSRDALTAEGREVRRWRLHQRTGHFLAGLAEAINPIVRGWMNYWGRYGRSQMNALLRRINTYLLRWARAKYKRLRAYRKANQWWDRVIERDPWPVRPLALDAQRLTTG